MNMGEVGRCLGTQKGGEIIRGYCEGTLKNSVQGSKETFLNGLWKIMELMLFYNLLEGRPTFFTSYSIIMLINIPPFLICNSTSHI